jgi:hypothetical protein
MRSLLLFLVLLACKGSPVNKGGGYDALGDTTDIQACNTHSDCVISCINDGTCCDTSCDCPARNKDWVARIQTHQGPLCTDAAFTCPEVKCPPSLGTQNPRCVEGKCQRVGRD